MISQAPVRDELAGVKWTGNVRPVDRATQARVLNQFHEEQRVRPAKLKPQCGDVKRLSPVALYILQLFATGKSTGAVAEACSCPRVHMVRFRKWFAECHGVEIQDVRKLADLTLDGLREYVVSKGGEV